VAPPPFSLVFGCTTVLNLICSLLLLFQDLLNLSNILDDMEQTGWIPYTSRTQYYNLYSKLYRLLMNKSSNSK
jgi:hypothetical protein